MLQDLYLWELCHESSIDCSYQDRPGFIETQTVKIYRRLINNKWEYKEIKETSTEKVKRQYFYL